MILLGSCAPGTPRARNGIELLGSCTLTWYPTNAPFQPRARTYSRNGIQPPKCARGSLPSSSLPRQRPLWALKGSKGAARQSIAMAAVSTNLSWEAEGVARQSAAGADKTVTEVLGICGLAGGRRPRLPTMPPALSTASLRTSASPPASGLAVEEYVATGISGTKASRPALVRLTADARAPALRHGPRGPVGPVGRERDRLRGYHAGAMGLRGWRPPKRSARRQAH